MGPKNKWHRYTSKTWWFLFHAYKSTWLGIKHHLHDQEWYTLVMSLWFLYPSTHPPSHAHTKHEDHGQFVFISHQLSYHHGHWQTHFAHHKPFLFHHTISCIIICFLMLCATLNGHTQPWVSVISTLDACLSIHWKLGVSACLFILFTDDLAFWSYPHVNKSCSMTWCSCCTYRPFVAQDTPF